MSHCNALNIRCSHESANRGLSCGAATLQYLSLQCLLRFHECIFTAGDMRRIEHARSGCAARDLNRKFCTFVVRRMLIELLHSIQFQHKLTEAT